MKLNYFITCFSIIVSSIIFAQDCEEGYTEIDENCYHDDDIEFLAGLIDRSNSSIVSAIDRVYEMDNSIPPPIDLNPLGLGYQIWENNRLVEFCSSNSDNATSQCYTEYKLAGGLVDYPSEIRYLDLRDNLIWDINDLYFGAEKIEYLYLSNNIISNAHNFFYDIALDNYPNLKELHISNNQLSSIPIHTTFSGDSSESELCDYLNNQLISYNFNNNHICDIDAPSCVNIGTQNVYTCCDGTEPEIDWVAEEGYENYMGNCYYSPYELNAIQIWTGIYNFPVTFLFNENHQIIYLDLSNNEINDEILVQNAPLFTSFEELQTLLLNDNIITTLPEEFLTFLPLSITTLDLSGNSITSLDDSYCELYNDANINLYYNPICESENLLSCLDNEACFVSDCSDSEACNYNQYANHDNGTCVYPETYYDCDSNCIAVIDECGECGGNGPIDGYDCNGTLLNINNIVPEKFELLGVYPNPFNPNTTISFSVNSYSNIIIKILNLNGVLVEQLVNQNLHPGIYTFQWHPKNISNGVYIISIHNGIEHVMEKITFIK